MSSTNIVACVIVVFGGLKYVDCRFRLILVISLIRDIIHVCVYISKFLSRSKIKIPNMNMNRSTIWIRVGHSDRVVHPALGRIVLFDLFVDDNDSMLLNQ